MNKETLQALKGSIKKWERIVKSTTAKDDGVNNCSLCKLFYSFCCADCPVNDKTNEVFCNNTPYQEWSNHQHEEHYNSTEANHRYVGCKECLILAKKELNFLKSLLPKVEK